MEEDLKTRMKEGVDMTESVLFSRWGTFCVKYLVAQRGDGFDDFRSRIWDFIRNKLDTLIEYITEISNSSGLVFILVALLENGSESIQAEMKKSLGTKKEFLRQALEKKQNAPLPVKDGKNKRKRPIGTPGLEILLKLIKQ